MNIEKVIEAEVIEQTAPAVMEVQKGTPEEITTLNIDINEGSVDVYKAKLENLDNISAVIKEHLIAGVDYGYPVAGASLPSLYQAGADKINLIYGLRAEYRAVKEASVLDHDKKFVMKVYECDLLCRKTGDIKATGSGSANNKEGNNGTRTFYDALHPVDLMARKRAKVNATKHVGILTSIFTQDIEDQKNRPVTGSKALSIYQKFGMTGNNMKPMRDYFSEIAIAEFNSTVPDEEKITSLHLGMTAFNQKVLEGIVNKIGVQFKEKKIKAPQEVWDAVMALKAKAPKVKVKTKKAKSKPKAPAKAKDTTVDPKAKRNARDYIKRQNGKVEAEEIAKKYAVPVELVNEYIEKYTKE